MKKVLTLLLVLMLALTFVACDEKEEVFKAFTFTDGIGREVALDEEPLKIVSLAPSMTEMVYALGLGDRLVGRTDYCNFPAETADVESVGSLTVPSMESIIALDPDIILISSISSEEQAAIFEEAGIPVAVLAAQESFEGIYEMLTLMGTIFGVESEAETLITDMKTDVDAVLDLVKDVDKKSVYYVVGFGEYGDYTATGDTFIHEMLEMAGGTNIAADGEFWSYNLESIIEKDPEVIICSELFDTKGQLEVAEGYMDLTAVKEGQLFEINQDLLSRQGPRLAEGLEAIAMLLHPELFE